MRNFQFQVVLTERCNLGCTYCYIHKNPVDMTIETYNLHMKSLRRLLELYSCDTYDLACFGGEPLLNWDLIEQIIPEARKDPSCRRIILVTNGLLLDDYRIHFLQSNEIHYSISFDGLWNDINRPLINGQPSFPQYEKARSLFGVNGCKVMVSPSSLPTLVENYGWFVEEFNMPFPDFTIVRDDIWSDDDVSLMDVKAKELADQVIEYIQSGKETMVGLFRLYMLDIVCSHMYGKRPYGCFAGYKGAGFMPNGMIYPCARFGSNQKFPLGNSITSEFYESNMYIMKSPEVANPRTYEECKVCKLYKICNAGCTYEQLVQRGGIYKAVPVRSVCEILKILYRESVRIADVLKDSPIFQKLLKNAISNCN